MPLQINVLIIAILIVSGCIKSDVEKPLPIELTRDHSCAVCGMITVDFQGAKAQIHYRNGKIDTFCCTLHMFSFYLQPDRPPNIAAIYVNDMGKADWEKPEGHWIDAKNAFYVVGGDVMGPHGEALVPFSGSEGAEDYKKEHGGEIIRFDDVTTDMLRPVEHPRKHAMDD
jgi:copper chaperone NosL